jgi:ABC-type multidrug transport system fused ATPase/permease subunit
MLEKYSALLELPHRTNIRTAHVSGLFFGYSQSIRFIYVGFVFFVAALFVQRYGLNSEQVFTGCYVVFVGAIGSGVSLSQMPSVSKAQQAARQVFGIIEEPSVIHPQQKGVKPVEMAGSIEFKNLYFRYPSRKQCVLRDLNL